jgi:hypothetical protein
MSPYEGEGDIEQERAEEIDGVKPGCPLVLQRGRKRFIQERLQVT